MLCFFCFGTFPSSFSRIIVRRFLPFSGTSGKNHVLFPLPRSITAWAAWHQNFFFMRFKSVHFSWENGTSFRQNRIPISRYQSAESVFRKKRTFMLFIQSDHLPPFLGCIGTEIFRCTFTSAAADIFFPFSVGLVVHCNLPLLTAGESTLGRQCR